MVFRLLACILTAVPVLSKVALAREATEFGKSLNSSRMIWSVFSETLALPGDEKIGMVSGSSLVEFPNGIRGGVGAYGALNGVRGGLIALGVESDFMQRISGQWFAHIGAFVGAGGGHGGIELTGDGLVIRGNLGIAYKAPRYGNFGSGISHVRFPSGTIASSQLYLQYEYPFYTLLYPGWSNELWELPSNAPPRIQTRNKEISAVLSHYTLLSAVTPSAYPQSDSMSLIGIEWVAYAGNGWFAKLESAGATGGQSKGYMQILAGGGYRFPLAKSTGLKLLASAGPAGGGGVNTGGGLLFDVGVSLQQALGRRTAVEVSMTRAGAPSSGFAARCVAAKLVYRFATPHVTGVVISLDALREFESRKLRIRFANQTYFKAENRWRNSHVNNSISNMGVQLDYFYLPSWFVTGQGLAAYAGGAGAYMTGQLGIGKRWVLTDRWFVEGEGLLGAAGGGGLEVGGGLVGQTNVSLGYHVGDAISLIGTYGRVQSRNGKFKANVVGVSLAYQLTAFAR